MTSAWSILPGLPSTGPAALPFSPNGRGTHSEGFVVTIAPTSGDAWTGNFQPGGGTLCDVLQHPDDKRLVVVSRGQAYVIQPSAPNDYECFGADFASAVVVESPAMLLLSTPTDVTALTSTDRWTSPRLAWDGIRDVTVRGTIVTGQGYDAVNSDWKEFTIDLNSRECAGGGYELMERSN